MQDLYFDHILISNANKRQWWMPQLYDNREEILNRIQYSSFLLLKKTNNSDCTKAILFILVIDRQLLTVQSP